MLLRDFAARCWRCWEKREVEIEDAGGSGRRDRLSHARNSSYVYLTGDLVDRCWDWPASAEAVGGLPGPHTELRHCSAASICSPVCKPSLLPRTSQPSSTAANTRLAAVVDLASLTADSSRGDSKRPLLPESTAAISSPQAPRRTPPGTARSALSTLSASRRLHWRLPKSADMQSWMAWVLLQRASVLLSVSFSSLSFFSTHGPRHHSVLMLAGFPLEICHTVGASIWYTIPLSFKATSEGRVTFSTSCGALLRVRSAQRCPLLRLRHALPAVDGGLHWLNWSLQA